MLWLGFELLALEHSVHQIDRLNEIKMALVRVVGVPDSCSILDTLVCEPCFPVKISEKS